MSKPLVARFVVHRSTEWAELAKARYFLKYLHPEWQEGAEDDDPVAQLLYDVQESEIPAAFEFVHRDFDKAAGTLFGEEGIEIDLLDEDDRLPIGAIIDLEIRVVGRVEFT